MSWCPSLSKIPAYLEGGSKLKAVSGMSQIAASNVLPVHDMCT